MCSVLDMSCARLHVGMLVVCLFLVLHLQGGEANHTFEESNAPHMHEGDNYTMTVSTVINQRNQYFWDDYPGRGYVVGGGSLLLFFIIVIMLVWAAYGNGWVDMDRDRLAQYRESREIRVPLNPRPQQEERPPPTFHPHTQPYDDSETRDFEYSRDSGYSPRNSYQDQPREPRDEWDRDDRTSRFRGRGEYV